MKITPRIVEDFIKHHPGCTQRDIARALPTGNEVYGSHKFVASAIVQLRAEGKLPDVKRCPHCKRAMTRGRSNLKLFLNPTDEDQPTLFPLT